MTNPLVSVVMPTYNGAGTVRESLESVLAQDYRPFEIVVVDDASSDDTVRVLREYGDRIRLIQRSHNSGVCDRARGLGVESSRGEVCAFIDQDDLWTPDKLSRQVTFMLSHPQYPLSHTYMRIVNGQGMAGEVRHWNRIPASGPCARELIEHCFITISSIMVKPRVWLDALQAHGNVHANSDQETFLWMLRQYPEGFGFIPEVLGSYRRWPQSMSKQNWKWSPEDVTALERVYAGGYWKGLVPRREVRRIIAEAYLENAEHWRHTGYPDRCRHFIRQGVHYRPLDRRWVVSCAKSLFRRTV